MTVFELEHYMRVRQSELLAEGRKRQLRNSVSRSGPVQRAIHRLVGSIQRFGIREARTLKPKFVPKDELWCCAL